MSNKKGKQDLLPDRTNGREPESVRALEHAEES